MKSFKTYEETTCGIKFFVRYMGKDVEGPNKWHIWSPDVDLNEYADTLWNSKEAALLTARTSIFVSKYGYPNQLRIPF